MGWSLNVWTSKTCGKRLNLAGFKRRSLLDKQFGLQIPRVFKPLNKYNIIIIFLDVEFVAINC